MDHKEKCLVCERMFIQKWPVFKDGTPNVRVDGSGEVCKEAFATA